MKNRFAYLAAGVLLAGTVFGLNPLRPAVADHEPANKVSAAGAAAEIVPPDTEVVILSEKVKTAKPTDLVLGVTAECSITTEVTTVGSETQSAEGTLAVWIEIDGKPVPVSKDDVANTTTGNEVGKVVLCNRLYQRTTSLGSDDQQDSIKTFMRTRNANGFNWMALNVGSATHLIEVKARLKTDATNRATALGVIGKRTLIVEPVKSANDEEVTAIG